MAFDTHSLNVKLAIEYGVNEALLIQHFIYWIRKNKSLGKNFRDGHYWTYQTRKEIASFFPYFKPDQVRRIYESLIQKGVLITANYNKSKIDKTNWFAFADEARFVPDFSKNVYDGQNCPSMGKIATPIPDTITEYIDKERNITKKERAGASAPLASDDAHLCAKYLFEKLNQKRKRTKEPSWHSWAKEMDLLMRSYKINKEMVFNTIDWLFNTENLFVVDSPHSLRKKYDNIADHMARPKRTLGGMAVVSQSPNNEDLMHKMYHVYKDIYREKCGADLKIQNNFLELKDGWLIDSKNNFKAKATLEKLIEILRRNVYVNTQSFENCLSIELKESLTIWKTNGIFQNAQK